MLARLAYFVGKAVASIRESPGVSVLAASTIATTLVVVGAFVMGLRTLESLTLVWGRSASIAAELRDDVPRPSWDDVRDRLAQLPNVANAQVVTPETALARFAARGPEAAALIDGVSAEVLPAVIELHMAPGFADLQALAALAAQVREQAEVGAVDYGQQELERLAALIDLLRGGGALVAVMFALATAFIVSNTIRLTVYARRDEISIQRLVGATGWFVRAPFVIEGALWGLAGGLLAAATLWVLDASAAPAITAAVTPVVEGLVVRLFAMPLGLGLLAGGAGLGVFGSLLAVRRFREEPL